MKAKGYYDIIADNLHHEMVVVFRNGNGIEAQGNNPCHMTINLLDSFLKYNTEFQLKSFLHNSTVNNATKHISAIIQCYLKINRFLNILDMLERCLNN